MSTTVEVTDTPAGGWSRADLRALVAGRMAYQVCPIAGREQAGAAIPLPDWLLEASTGGDESTWSGRLRAVHPQDRAAVARGWREAIARPREIVRYTVRARAGTELHLFEESMLNLEGHQGLNVVVTSEDRGLTADIDDWDALEQEYDFESTAVAIQYLDEFGTMLWVEGQVHEIFGRPAAELVGHWALECILEEHHDTLLALWLSLVAEPGRIQSMRLQITRPDRSPVWVETTLINRLEDSRVGAVVVLSHDITDQLASEEEGRKHEAAMRRSHEEFAVLANQVPAAVFRADPDGRITFANLHWRQMAGVDAARNASPVASGAPDHDQDRPVSLYDVVTSEDRRTLESTLLLLFGSDDGVTESAEVRSRDGARVFCLTCQSISAARDGLDRVIIGSMTDVTSTTHLRHRAVHDGLTGLLNRTGIDTCLDEAIHVPHASVVVAFIDLDGFKTVNDENGHDAGDHVLRTVAARLQDAMRPSDHLGRYGGDEFVIVCPNASANAEHAIRTRVQAVMSTPIDIPGGRWSPGASIGLARSCAGEGAAELMQKADRAMYTMKRAGHGGLRARSRP